MKSYDSTEGHKDFFDGQESSIQQQQPPEGESSFSKEPQRPVILYF